MPKYYTVKEVAEIFKKSVYTIYRWIDQGRVFQEVVKVNDGYLIPEIEVERIIRDGKIPNESKET